MLNKIHARFASLALFVAASAFVFSACDSGGSGVSPGDVNTGAADTLQLSSMSPDLGADVDETQPTLTLTFSQSIEENEYTAEMDQQDSEAAGTRRLADAIQLTPKIAKDHNAASPSNSIPVNIEWRKERTRLDVTPTEELQNGYIYTLSLGNESQGTGVYNPRFKGTSGDLFNNEVANPALDASALSFSVNTSGNEAPAVPDVSFETDNPLVAGEGSLEDEVLDYTDGSVTAPLEIDNPNSGNVEVKGYEVYYRSQNQLGDGDGDQFVKAGVENPAGNTATLDPEASSDDFEDWNGIIPLDEALNPSEFDDGEAEFTVTIPSTPFQADDNSYDAIEWKVRAVSVNGVRSEFTDVITTGDNTDVDVIDSDVVERDGDGDIEEIVVTFDEPLQTSSVDAGDFTIEEDVGTDVEDVGISVADADYEVDVSAVPEEGDQTGTSVLLDITEDDGNRDDIDGDDDLNVTGVDDLAGNGVGVNEVDVN